MSSRGGVPAVHLESVQPLHLITACPVTVDILTLTIAFLRPLCHHAVGVPPQPAHAMFTRPTMYSTTVLASPSASTRVVPALISPMTHLFPHCLCSLLRPGTPNAPRLKIPIPHDPFSLAMVPSRAVPAQSWGQTTLSGLGGDERRRVAALHHRAWGSATGASMPRGLHRSFPNSTRLGSAAAPKNTVKRVLGKQTKMLPNAKDDEQNASQAKPNPKNGYTN
ncbi:hypothetical protein C8F04DRAFT_1331612 [Mycena alexandri]|uniref:Uncharacterized protein n=1 Tax=Mycena alexandri TaxID=1745969 RepID=A0AAD6X6F7_9AGAR|nr:hypothetical protein C8F04DRAFT_1331612 [Mycena alexandri]